MNHEITSETFPTFSNWFNAGNSSIRPAQLMSSARGFTEVDYLAKTICHGGLLLCPWAFDCGAPYVTYLEAPYVTLKQSKIEMNGNDKTCTNILWVVAVSSGGKKGGGLSEKPTRAIWVLSFGFQGYLLFVSNVHSDFDEPFLCFNSGCSYAGNTPEVEQRVYLWRFTWTQRVSFLDGFV